MPTTLRTKSRHPRGFTLLELIVTILVIGVLAAIAVLGYTLFTERAQVARVRTNLHQYAVATLAHATSTGAVHLSRGDVTTALADSDRTLSDTYAGPTAVGSPLHLLTSDKAPNGPDDLALAFDDGDGTPASDTSGSRLWLASATPGGQVYVQLITLSGGVGCSATQQAGTVVATARLCATKPKFVDTTSVTTVSGWPVDVTPDQAATLSQSPTNGQTSLTGTGAVRYVSTDTFVGSDAYNYTTSSGLHQVLVTVSPALACSTTTPVDAGWVPSGPGTTPSCPIVSAGEAPTTPDSAAPATATGDMTIRALASYPHSDPSYPHVIYAATANGGLAWVQDTGNQGTTSPGGLVGCAGPAPTCRWGWLDAPGTFTGPTAAITGQGPNHGTIPAVFSVDSMFVADTKGIWVSRVNAFVRGTSPVQVLPASSYSGTVVALTGFTCYSGLTKQSGNCLWFLTSTGQLGEVNVDTGTSSTTTVSVPAGSYGPFGAFLDVTATTQSGAPQLLVTSTSGHVAHVRPDGTLMSVTWQTAGVTLTALTGVGTQQAFSTDYAKVVMGTPTGPTWGAPVTFSAPGVPSALHSHGVPGQLYVASLDSSSCLYRVATGTGAANALWCGPALPTITVSGRTMAITWPIPVGYLSGDVSCTPTSTPPPSLSSISTISGTNVGTSWTVQGVYGATYSCNVTMHKYTADRSKTMTVTTPAVSATLDPLVPPTLSGAIKADGHTAVLSWTTATPYVWVISGGCTARAPYSTGWSGGTLSSSWRPSTSPWSPDNPAIHGVTYDCAMTYGFPDGESAQSNTVTITGPALVAPTLAAVGGGGALTVSWNETQDLVALDITCVPQSPYPAGVSNPPILYSMANSGTSASFTAPGGVRYTCSGGPSFYAAGNDPVPAVAAVSAVS